jgi:hypothetical protein
MLATKCLIDPLDFFCNVYCNEVYFRSCYNGSCAFPFEAYNSFNVC